MSRTTEKRKGEPREYEVVTEMRCDLCGATTMRVLDGKAREDWGTGRCDVSETTVERKTGTAYPEGGYSKTASYDICPQCWETKLVPWLESQGAKSPHITETDW